jgi:hypothetical protein
MYIDQATFSTDWEELYDAAMRPWKILGLYLHTIYVPSIGPIESTSLIYPFWDIRQNHASFLGGSQRQRLPSLSQRSGASRISREHRYSTPLGLNLIMR